MYGTHNVYLSFVEKNMARGTPGRADPISYIHHQVSKIHHLPLPPYPLIATTAVDSAADRYFATDPRTHIGINTQIFIFIYICLFKYIYYVHYTHVYCRRCTAQWWLTGLLIIISSACCFTLFSAVYAYV